MMRGTIKQQTKQKLNALLKCQTKIMKDISTHTPKEKTLKKPPWGLATG